MQAKRWACGELGELGEPAWERRQDILADGEDFIDGRKGCTSLGQGIPNPTLILMVVRALIWYPRFDTDHRGNL